MPNLFQRPINYFAKMTIKLFDYTQSRMGSIYDGFHFLGVHYLPTRTEDTINMTHANDVRIEPSVPDHSLVESGGGR